jgi:hypothetical protein
MADGHGLMVAADFLEENGFDDAAKALTGLARERDTARIADLIRRGDAAHRRVRFMDSLEEDADVLQSYMGRVFLQANRQGAALESLTGRNLRGVLVQMLPDYVRPLVADAEAFLEDRGRTVQFRLRIGDTHYLAIDQDKLEYRMMQRDMPPLSWHS